MAKSLCGHRRDRIKSGQRVADKVQNAGSVHITSPRPKVVKDQKQLQSTILGLDGTLPQVVDPLINQLYPRMGWATEITHCFIAMQSAGMQAPLLALISKQPY